MVHHGPSPFDDLGATGEFPEGKLVEEDQGEMKFAIGTRDGKVIIDFGEKMGWIGFTPKQAMELSAMIVKHAASLVTIERKEDAVR